MIPDKCSMEIYTHSCMLCFKSSSHSISVQIHIRGKKKKLCSVPSYKRRCLIPIHYVSQRSLAHARFSLTTEKRLVSMVQNWQKAHWAQTAPKPLERTYFRIFLFPSALGPLWLRSPHTPSSPDTQLTLLLPQAIGLLVPPAPTFYQTSLWLALVLSGSSGPEDEDPLDR